MDVSKKCEKQLLANFDRTQLHFMFLFFLITLDNLYINDSIELYPSECKKFYDFLDKIKNRLTDILNGYYGTDFFNNLTMESFEYLTNDEKQGEKEMDELIQKVKKEISEKMKNDQKDAVVNSVKEQVQEIISVLQLCAFKTPMSQRESVADCEIEPEPTTKTANEVVSVHDKNGKPQPEDEIVKYIQDPNPILKGFNQMFENNYYNKKHALHIKGAKFKSSDLFSRIINDNQKIGQICQIQNIFIKVILLIHKINEKLKSHSEKTDTAEQIKNIQIGEGYIRKYVIFERFHFAYHKGVKGYKTIKNLISSNKGGTRKKRINITKRRRIRAGAGADENFFVSLLKQKSNYFKGLINSQSTELENKYAFLHFFTEFIEKNYIKNIKEESKLFDWKNKVNEKMEANKSDSKTKNTMNWFLYSIKYSLKSQYYNMKESIRELKSFAMYNPLFGSIYILLRLSIEVTFYGMTALPFLVPLFTLSWGAEKTFLLSIIPFAADPATLFSSSRDISAFINYKYKRLSKIGDLFTATGDNTLLINKYVGQRILIRSA